MNMIFLDNRKILFVVAIVVLVIMIGAAGVLSWQKAQVSFDISPGAIKAKCTENVGKMTDDELINEIRNLKNPEKAVDSTEKDRMAYAVNKTGEYFLCRMEYEKKNEIYDTAKNFIQELMVDKENRRVKLDRLDKIYNFPWNIYLSDSGLRWYANIAMGEVLSMCKIIDVEADLESIESSLEKFVKTGQILVVPGEINIFDKIKKLCIVFDKYAEDASLFIQSELNAWEDNKEALKNQMTARSAAAFYLGGKDLALKVCDSVPGVDEELRNFCAENISFWADLKRCKRYNYGGIEECEVVKECKTIGQELAELICAID